MYENLNAILPRDEHFSKQEAAAGMHHTFYWWRIISKYLGAIGVPLNHDGMNTVSTGEHWGTFTDPVTRMTYQIIIKPINQNARAA